MCWGLAVLEVGRFSRIGLAFGFFLPLFTFVNMDKEACIRQTHLYYQIDRDKVSEWSCAI